MWSGGRTASDGTVTEARAIRVTYAQNRPAYNLAQTTEKAHFCQLLHDLCASVTERERDRSRGGRPPIPIQDALFAAAFKLYSTVSARRFDLREACEAGLIGSTPHFNSVLNYLDNEELTPIIQGLVTQSSLPLRAVETDFAVDSTGFGTCRTFGNVELTAES